jgi:hypothetical protein
MNPNLTPPDNHNDESPLTNENALPLYDAIALRAYFIALERHRNGGDPDPLKDWLEAEQQLIKAPDR